MSKPIRVTVWNEFLHERDPNPEAFVPKLYPRGIHETIAGFLRTDASLEVRTATIDEPEHGLTRDVLDSTDVLIWWSHMLNDQVSDEVARRVCERVRNGMGLMALHSALGCKPFGMLVGMHEPVGMKWREVGERERIWVIEPGHPIAAGLGECIELPHDEMYGEPSGFPTPDELVFISWFEGGEVFRSGCVWKRGRGKVFYFRPGHEDCPTYHLRDVQRVIRNAVHWLALRHENARRKPGTGPHGSVSLEETREDLSHIEYNRKFHEYVAAYLPKE